MTKIIFVPEPKKEVFVQEQLYLELPDIVEEQEKTEEKNEEEIERGIYIIELF